MGIERPSYRRLRAVPITGTLGAEVSGLTLARPLDDETRAELLDAFDRYLVLVLRDQPMTPEQHLAFSLNFGPHQDLPHIPLVDGYPQLQAVKREAGEARGRVAGQNWHSDSSFLPMPPLGVVMRAEQIPDVGGDTAFANMCTAYESLSPAMRAMIDPLRAVHSATRVFGRESLKRDVPISMRANVSVDEGEKESVHPVVRTHPRTGRKGLFVNRTYTQRLEGMTADESLPLLQMLWSLADKPEFGCRIRWQPDTVVIWDNRFTMHRAIVDYDGQRRSLVRTTIQGERPA